MLVGLFIPMRSNRQLTHLQLHVGLANQDERQR